MTKSQPVVIGGELREEFVVRDASRSRQLCFGAHPCPDLLRDPCRRHDPFEIFGDVKVCASSSDSGSMIGVYSAKICRIWREIALYTSNRGFTKIRSAHFRLAMTDGSAERTPNRRAS
jgi:hypothetical protein